MNPQTSLEPSLPPGHNDTEREFINQTRARIRQIFPHGKLDLFDIWFGPTSTLFFLAQGIERDNIVLVNGDDLLDRLVNILKAKYLKGETMAKEIGIPKGASKKAKKMDERMDKKMGMKEGSTADLKADRAMAQKYPTKRGK